MDMNENNNVKRQVAQEIADFLAARSETKPVGSVARKMMNATHDRIVDRIKRGHRMNFIGLRTDWITVVLLILSLGIAQADDKRDRHQRREPNWIIERQTSYQVEGVPTSRIIVGKREIDIYPNGLMFEKGNVVGIKK
jgi:hypothetical protein